MVQLGGDDVGEARAGVLGAHDSLCTDGRVAAPDDVTPLALARLRRSGTATGGFPPGASMPRD